MKNSLLLLLLVVAMVMASCSKAPKSLQLLPDDTYSVVRVDVKKLLDKSKIADNKQLREKLAQALKGEQMGEALRTKLEQVMDNPAKAGLDLRQPLYIALSGDLDNPTVTLAGTVLKSRDLDELLKAAGAESGLSSQEQDGVTFYEDGEMLFAFDDDNFLVTAVNGENTRAEALQRFGQQPNVALPELEEVAQMEQKNGVLQFLVMGKSLKNVFGTEDFKKFAGTNANPDDLAVVFDLDTDKGLVRLVADVLAKSDEWKSAIKKSDKVFDDIDGDALKYVPKRGIAFFVHIDGKEYSKLLADDASRQQLLSAEQKELLQRVLTTVDGDFAIGVSASQQGNDPFSVSAYLKTKDGSLLEEVRDLARMGVNTGFDKGFTYLSLGSAPFAEAKETFAKSDVKGKHAYFYADAEAFALVSGFFGSFRQLAPFVEPLANVDVAYSEGGHVKAQLHLKDNSKDVLEWLVDMAGNMLQ